MNAPAWFCIGLAIGVVGTLVAVLWLDEWHVEREA